VPEAGDTIRVLLVDDHAVVRRGLFAFLDSEPDLEVVGEADGGAQALELLDRLGSEGRRPHAVLMDLAMEPLDGIETTRQIRSRYSDVEVVALTSFGEEERVRAALEAGASGYDVVFSQRVPQWAGCGPDNARARCPPPPGSGEHQPADRRRAGDQRANGTYPRLEHPAQARSHLAHTSSAVGRSRRSHEGQRRVGARP
jgi:CheY-like chemotaxis protein